MLKQQKQFGLMLVVLVSSFLGGCDLLNDTAAKPWMGYAWNMKQKRVEWFFNSFETHRDCEESMLHAIETPPNDQWYSKPIGCGYSGNDYWRVLIMNALFGGKDLGCIARSMNGSANGMGYGPVLDRTNKRGEGWYCV
ncbi:hypothetical protein I6F35_02430 [Bradyrhizobium sp. BRP22]|uniref:hypothetical protein n=1 Tax=Bradyrhizobium sp. BRP22 TaxID=2793821 RepID=UPI001CD3B3C6|nr:hypothetical protein [Bradyrhizobium sp. BRP22]MCA1452072.1 hypothetical protein [Bradyrhizobium sp. BRP22]